MSKAQAQDTPRINPTLLARKQWLVWRSVPDPAHPDKKPRKVPYYVSGSPRSGKLDTPQDIARLASISDAVLQLETYPKRWAGIGLAINQGVQFIDLDGIRDPKTGAVQAEYLPLLEEAVRIGAYVEVSVSATGLHILGEGEPMTTVLTGTLDIHSHGRFCAMGQPLATGNPEGLPDLRALDPLIEPLLKQLKPKLARPDNVVDIQAPKHTPLMWRENKPEVIRCLSVINPDIPYPKWVEAGMAIHHASGGAPEACRLWEDWSREGDKYKEGDCVRRWPGFSTEMKKGITMATLVAMAREALAERPLNAKLPAGLPPRMRVADLMRLEVPPVQWLVEGLVAPGLTLLAAPPKTGKSYFVLQMGLCISSGLPFLGMKTNKAQVVYLNLEEWHRLLQNRIRPIAASMQVSHDVFDLEVDIETPEDPIGYAQEQFDNGVDLIIVDIFARVRDEMSEDTKAGVYARDYDAMKSWADVALANPGKSVVMVHHANKGEHEAWQNRISGSNGIAGATHTNIVMVELSAKGVEEEAKPRLKQYRRLHFSGKEVTDTEIMIKQLPEGGGWMATMETEADIRQAHKQTQILAVLKGTPGKWVPGLVIIKLIEGTDDVSRAVRSSWYRVLKRMSDSGAILSGGSGGDGYCLPIHGSGK